MHLKIGDLLSDNLEEDAVLGWEHSLFSYLQAPQREHMLESWNQAIKRKIEK